MGSNKHMEDNIIEIPTYTSETLESVITRLMKLRNEGKDNYCTYYNGVKLYASDIDIEKAYVDCLGCTRKTWFIEQRKNISCTLSDLDKWKLEAQEKVPYWILEAKKYIHPKKLAKWELYCLDASESDFYGLEIDKALEIMKMIDEGVSYSEIKKHIKDDGHSGRSYALTMNLILRFANNGPKAYAFIAGKKTTKIERQYISKMKQFNMLLDQGLSYEEALLELREHKIYDIEVLYDFHNTGKYQKYRNFKGSLLVNDDMSFEGMIDNGDFVTGTILGNNDGIALAGFNNNLKASLYYCGMGNDGIAYGNYDIRYDDEIIKRCPVMIKFFETDKGFDDEIELRSSVAKTKNNLYKEKRIVYEWYKNNRDLEIKR